MKKIEEEKQETEEKDEENEEEELETEEGGEEEKEEKEGEATTEDHTHWIPGEWEEVRVVWECDLVPEQEHNSG